MRSVLNRWVLLATVLALVATGALAAVLLRPASHRTSEAAAAGACAPGFQPVLDALAEVRAEMRDESAGEADAEQGDADREAGSGVDAELAREAVKDLPMLAGTDPDTWAGLCVRSKRPESLQELSSMFGARAISRLA
ncbi:MAG: hypothetical protein ACXVW0_14230, partial [Nocardioides sp.]